MWWKEIMSLEGNVEYRVGLVCSSSGRGQMWWVVIMYLGAGLKCRLSVFSPSRRVKKMLGLASLIESGAEI